MKELELDYNLAELPSSQHRAGLAGLVLMVKWLERDKSRKGLGWGNNVRLSICCIGSFVAKNCKCSPELAMTKPKEQPDSLRREKPSGKSSRSWVVFLSVAGLALAVFVVPFGLRAARKYASRFYDWKARGQMQDESSTRG